MREINSNEMTLGQRMVLAARMAAEMHVNGLDANLNGDLKTSRTTTAEAKRLIGGAGLIEVKDDLRRARTESSNGARDAESNRSRAPRVFYVDFSIAFGSGELVGADSTFREGAD